MGNTRSVFTEGQGEPTPPPIPMQRAGSGFWGVPQVCTPCSNVLTPTPAQLEHILTSGQAISPKGEIGTLGATSPFPDPLGPWPARVHHHGLKSHSPAQ